MYYRNVLSLSREMCYTLRIPFFKQVIASLEAELFITINIVVLSLYVVDIALQTDMMLLSLSRIAYVLGKPLTLYSTKK